jgi:hypothetical protein
MLQGVGLKLESSFRAERFFDFCDPATRNGINGGEAFPIFSGILCLVKYSGFQVS